MMFDEIYEIYKRNFPFINREEKTAKEIIENQDNIIFKKRNSNNELIGCAIVNENAIILLVVDEKYRNNGIGTELLNKCEEIIINSGFDKVVLGVGFNYLMPGVPTSKKYTESVHENLRPEVNENASDFFEKRGYKHSWKKCNCFDMQMSLDNIKECNNTLGNTITFRWAILDDLDSIVECADDACQYQDEKFSKYYINPKLYEKNNNQKVLVAIKNSKIVGALIVSIETEGKDLGCVGCTCVSFKETRQGIGSNLVMLGTKYLKDIGLKNASLSYTYTGLDKLYGATGYEISTYYFMGEKNINSLRKSDK